MSNLFSTETKGAELSVDYEGVRIIEVQAHSDRTEGSVRKKKFDHYCSSSKSRRQNGFASNNKGLRSRLCNVFTGAILIF